MSIYFARGARKAGRVGGFPPLQPSSSRLVVRPSALFLLPRCRFAAPSCCWHVITKGSRPFLLSYSLQKRAEIVSPPSGTNSSLPSKTSIAALYQEDLQHPNRAKKSQSGPFCPNVVGRKSSNYECQASVRGSLARGSIGNRCPVLSWLLSGDL